MRVLKLNLNVLPLFSEKFQRVQVRAMLGLKNVKKCKKKLFFPPQSKVLIFFLQSYTALEICIRALSKKNIGFV